MIKKSLGQNFFVNENLGKTIIQYIAESNPDVIVEIGPGRGFFTEKLEKLNKELLLVEKDDDLAKSLSQTYSSVVNIDFLDWDFKEIEKYKSKKILFFGSLPYNVSKPIIQKVISSKFFNMPAYFIIQKEVAEKYTSKAPNNNILSIKTQYFAQPKKLIDINPGSFLPAPKVISSFIQFSPITKLPNVDFRKFLKFVERCFRSPRKTLNNNLKGFSLNKYDAKLLSKRPQELTLEEYITLFQNIDTSSVI